MKISIKYYVLGIMGLLLLFLNTYYLIPNTYAAESTPSADIKAKLEELKKEIASRAAKLKQEVSGKLKDRVYIGKVKTKSASSITLATKNGPKIVNLNQDTVFESKVKGKKIDLKLVSEEDYLASLGDVDETSVLTAKKVILLPSPQSEVKTAIWGQVVSISDKLVTIKTKDAKNIAATIPENVRIQEFVILTGYMGKNEIFDAEFVYIIPQGLVKPKKIATPSAKVASPSATPKATTRPLTP